MNSSEFLKEENLWDDDDAMEAEIVKIQNYYGLGTQEVQFGLQVREQCQPFLKRIDYNISEFPMYRGIKNDNSPLIAKEARLADRIPKDITPEVHAEINELFTDKYGAPFRNSVFVSGDKYMTADYGNPYIIFPVGEFQILWTPDFPDLFVTADGLRSMVRRVKVMKRDGKFSKNQQAYWDHYAKSHNIDGIQPEDVTLIKFLDKAEYRTDDLRNGIKSGHEIMLRCTEYLGMNNELNSESKEGIARIISIR